MAIELRLLWIGQRKLSAADSRDRPAFHSAASQRVAMNVRSAPHRG